MAVVLLRSFHLPVRLDMHTIAVVIATQSETLENIKQMIQARFVDSSDSNSTAYPKCDEIKIKVRVIMTNPWKLKIQALCRIPEIKICLLLLESKRGLKFQHVREVWRTAENVVIVMFILMIHYMCHSAWRGWVQNQGENWSLQRLYVTWNKIDEKKKHKNVLIKLIYSRFWSFSLCLNLAQ